MPRSVEFAFTVSLKPDMYRYDIASQYRHGKSVINNVLYNTSGCLDYRFYPELTKAMNIHFHGVVKFTTKNKMITALKTLNLLCGFSMYKGKPDEGWIKYMIKHCHITAKYLDCPLMCFRRVEYHHEGPQREILNLKQEYIDAIENEIQFIDEEEKKQ